MSTIKALPEELQKVAIQELGEVPERLAEDLQDFKAWIRQQPHLRARLDDQFLVQFLRGCKFSTEKAKRKIDQFFSLRSKHTDMRSIIDVDEPKFRQFLETHSYAFLPTPLNDNGPRIVVIQINFSIEVFSPTDIFQYAVSISEVGLMSDPYACIHGLIFVLDYAKATPSFLLLLTPNLIKNLVTYFENTLPIRIKGVYIINMSTAAVKVTNFLLSFVPQKLKERFFLCDSNLDNLGELMPKKYLPRDYGGENGSIVELSTENYKVWDEYRDYFKQNAEFGADESLRMGGPADSHVDFGFQGTFRMLNVD